MEFLSKVDKKCSFFLKNIYIPVKISTKFFTKNYMHNKTEFNIIFFNKKIAKNTCLTSFHRTKTKIQFKL